MRSGSARSLAICLLLTLAMPAPRMAAWLIAGAPPAVFTSGRSGPQARGSNRVPPIQAAEVSSTAQLASGTSDPVVHPAGPSVLSTVAGLARPTARASLIVAAPAAGPPRLRC